MRYVLALCVIGSLLVAGIAAADTTSEPDLIVWVDLDPPVVDPGEETVAIAEIGTGLVDDEVATVRMLVGGEVVAVREVHLEQYQFVEVEIPFSVDEDGVHEVTVEVEANGDSAAETAELAVGNVDPEAIRGQVVSQTTVGEPVQLSVTAESLAGYYTPDAEDLTITIDGATVAFDQDDFGWLTIPASALPNEPGLVEAELSYGEVSTTVPLPLDVDLEAIHIEVDRPMATVESSIEVAVVASYSDGSSVTVTDDAGVYTRPWGAGLIEDGTLEVTDPGEIGLEAYYHGLSANRTVRITPKPTALNLTVANESIAVDETTTFAVEGHFDGTSVEVTPGVDVELEDESLVAVERNTIEGIAAGETTITVHYGGESATATVTVEADGLPGFGAVAAALAVVVALVLARRR